MDAESGAACCTLAGMAEETGRIAWITGGGTGIGRELALRLAAHGWTVAISGRRAEPLVETVAAGTPGRVHAFPLDVCDPEANRGCVARIEAELGPIELAVLNAGIFRPLKTSEFSPEPFEEMMRVNYLGVVNGVWAVLPQCVNAVAAISR
jgi:NAD(P)-dependent dehydrogenase (short-subunit alcohol dehydrogenase family)